ncbi:MAG: TadE/TadG family type IV pilus assembly protein [Actinomycetota bacterium]|nr:TadE/TadG family type IV pilus assembly protein [Actinomycetota bacterium]
MNRPAPRSPGARTATPPAGADRGQATVELALALPLLCLLLFAVVQVAVVGRDQLAVQLAAREAARAASVAADPVAAGTTAAHRAIALRPLTVQIIPSGSTVTAIVQYTQRTDVPLVGAVLPDVVLGASVTMAFEPP